MRVPLRPVERRLVLLTGDAIAVLVATLLALWTWSLTAGFPFDSAFILAHAEWFGAIPLWLAVLIPTREIRVALDLGRTSVWIVQSGIILLVFYFALFFYVGPQRLPRLMAMYLVWDASWLLFGWRLVAQAALSRARFRRRVLIVCPRERGLGDRLVQELGGLGPHATGPWYTEAPWQHTHTWHRRSRSCDSRTP